MNDVAGVASSEWRFHGAVPLEESNALRSRERGKSGLVVGMRVRARPLVSYGRPLYVILLVNRSCI